jgi:hypothetical protein
MKKAALIDEEVAVGVGARKIRWKVRFDIKADDVAPARSEEFDDVGVCDFDFSTPSVTTKKTATPKNKKKKRGNPKKPRINFLRLSMHLWPGKWEEQLERMNIGVESNNDHEVQKKRNLGKRHKKVHEITKNEFWVFFGLMTSARTHGRQGQLWDDEEEEPEGIELPVNLAHHVMKHRFQEIKKVVPCTWEQPENKETIITTEICFASSRSSRTNSQEKSTHVGGIASRVTMRPLE